MRFGWPCKAHEPASAPHRPSDRELYRASAVDCCRSAYLQEASLSSTGIATMCLRLSLKVAVRSMQGSAILRPREVQESVGIYTGTEGALRKIFSFWNHSLPAEVKNLRFIRLFLHTSSIPLVPSHIFEGILMPPSNLMTVPLSIVFSIECLTVIANS